MIPLIIFYITAHSILAKRPVFEDFVSGAHKGIVMVFKLLPTFTGLIVATGILRTSGFMDFLTAVVKRPAVLLHVPEAVIPVALIRMISNSAAVGLMLDIFKNYGADSIEGRMAAVLMSSTETLIYCLSVYFGSRGIKKTGYAVPGSLLALLAGMAAAVFICSS